MEVNKEHLVFEKAKICEHNKIMDLYKYVIKTTFTTWDEYYPSVELITEDIKNENLYVLKYGNEIVAVSFLGQKNDDDDGENWILDLKKPMGVARICVNPDFQGNGIGTYFMQLLMGKAKQMGADGMRFHVATQNISAMKMYEKCGFKNWGLGRSDFGFDYYRFEQKF